MIRPVCHDRALLRQLLSVRREFVRRIRTNGVRSPGRVQFHISRSSSFPPTVAIVRCIVVRYCHLYFCVFHLLVIVFLTFNYHIHSFLVIDSVLHIHLKPKHPAMTKSSRFCQQATASQNFQYIIFYHFAINTNEDSTKYVILNNFQSL